MIKRLIATALFFLLTSMMPIVCAADPASAPKMTDQEFLASLKFQQGKIDLPGGIASLTLPDSFRYLDPAGTERVLVDAWGNPPGNKTLGMIIPTDTSPLSEAGWGVVITYLEDGYVKDDEADSIKYDDMLKKMQEATIAENDERKKQGYAAMKLVGWAENPSYDKSTHKYYWAMEFASDGASGSTLNYNIRVLGRKGVLVLNAVASMKQIGEIKKQMPQVVAFTEFSKGNRYVDFDSKTDKIAEYGLAALVAGGVAAKLGLFGKIFAFLLVFKKLLLAGLAAAGAGLAKFFGGRKKDADQ